MSAKPDLLTIFDSGGNADIEHLVTGKADALACTIGGFEKTDRQTVGLVVAAGAEGTLAGTAKALEKFGKNIFGCRMFSGAALQGFLEGGRSRRFGRRPPFGVETLPCGFILDLIIGGRHLLETRLLACCIALALGVGMQPLGESAIGRLDLGISRVARESQNFVRIAHGVQFSIEMKPAE